MKCPRTPEFLITYRKYTNSGQSILVRLTIEHNYSILFFVKLQEAFDNVYKVKETQTKRLQLAGATMCNW